MIDIKLTKQQLNTLICLVDGDRKSLKDFMVSECCPKHDIPFLEEEVIFLSKLLNKLEKGLK